MRRMKKRGPNVLFDLNDLFFLTYLQLIESLCILAIYAVT